MVKSEAMKYNNRLFSSELFVDVQMSSLFEDSKTFSDAVAKKPLKDILGHYNQVKAADDFDLQHFVMTHFHLPAAADASSVISKDTPVLSYINHLWHDLTRAPDVPVEDSLIPLPNAYIVPGGRFREVYYWDTYFTALGLELDGHDQLILDTFQNFQHLLDVNGCIPNGNRDYYRGRSQPPILAMLYELIINNKTLCLENNLNFLDSALKSLMQEHDFWMRGAAELSVTCPTLHRVVQMPDGSILNRYWDDDSGPRPESYKEDQELAEHLSEAQQREFYTHIRAACESGWDFSSRWLKKPNDLTTIRTTDIVPIDLNCLLWKLENTIFQCLESQGAQGKAHVYRQLAEKRQQAIQHYCWDADTRFYHDYCYSEQGTTGIFSLAGAFPLYFNMASAPQAESIANMLKTDFLKSGGLVTTLTQSPQQWDSPNGWAPLQWIAVIALENYGFKALAKQVMNHWNNGVALNFQQTGCLMEKYNVNKPGELATGGEYLVQQGFGWTNGVTRAFHQKLRNS